ncbi:adenylate/guanylate cyclase domain-containing protein [Staphylococcus hominis]|uniref:adenylate/guanylate cyclase domain-containing protein n=1 Tax=Staphylococcus hominis TaxID=1290 RepID=UPI0008A25594|nr:adenylate cyclase [Staphylococcus hominis]MDU6764444.1 adenylate cyclase [Staphylococcus sp.]OFM77859.1 adenylate cyclase [Staphylococcus sp. HMSC074B09]MBO0372429.1 adenylate cyclase [Staphylococcus hominis]MCI2896588.1 adenylate cyclase [Staphylococcus hominis]MDS3900014.1 adenylate cyclase [Staphylococcus hominis]
MEIRGYDYKSRKKKVEEILENTNFINEVKRFPNNDDFTYENGYKAWLSAIFIDLRNSTKLFTENSEIDVAKVIRGFTSEVIEILQKDTQDNELKEIGIRGDCVFAVYSTPFKNELFDVFQRAVYINTYLKMLNKLLDKRNLPNIKAGIGLAADENLAVKAGRKSSGINDLVWIGKAVTTASNLADLGNKEGICPIVMSDIFYSNYIDVEKNENSKNWWTKNSDVHNGTYYHGNVVKIEFNEWIESGMID